jgi:hypothetical protein
MLDRVQHFGKARSLLALNTADHDVAGQSICYFHFDLEHCCDGNISILYQHNVSQRG